MAFCTPLKPKIGQKEPFFWHFPPFYSTKKTEYLSSASTLLGNDIRCENGILEITLPSLLPKKMQHQSSEFLLDPLHNALSQYAEHHDLPRYHHCVVCFSHIYCRDLPDRRVRDYDNLELKRFLDLVASFVLVDDSGLLCDAYNSTELGGTDCTRISIMDSAQFSDWLEKREKALKTISDF